MNGIQDTCFFLMFFSLLTCGPGGYVIIKYDTRISRIADFITMKRRHASGESLIMGTAGDGPKWRNPIQIWGLNSWASEPIAVDAPRI